MATEMLEVIGANWAVMLALFINSLLLYKTLIGLLMFVRRVRFDEVQRETLDRLAEARPVTPRIRSRALAYLPIEAVDEVLHRFKQIVAGRVKYSRAMIIAAPLLGLLGTVQGMLITFHGLAQEERHEITRSMADGIYRALFATEVGLVIAIPALFLINWIKRETQRHELRLLDMKMQLMTQTKA